jgi:hypothetical protein
MGPGKYENVGRLRPAWMGELKERVSACLLHAVLSCLRDLSFSSPIQAGLSLNLVSS